MVDEGIVARQPSLQRAIVTTADMAGMEDKQAADACGLDPATWSKVKSGQANFPPTKLRNYQQRCGLWLPLQWLARDCGFGIVKLESALERENRLLREERDAEREKRIYAESLLTRSR